MRLLRGVEAVLGKEAPGCVGGEQLSVKNMDTLSAYSAQNSYIMAHHNDGHALLCHQPAQEPRQLAPKSCPNPWWAHPKAAASALSTAHLCQGGALLLTAGQVVGMVL